MIRTEVRDGVIFWITIDQPDALNALDPESMAALAEARFGLPEARWAVFPGGGGTTRLVRQIGYARAMDLLLTGRMINADEAKEIGLINEIVEPDRLEERVTEIANEIAGNGTLAVRKIKESAWRQMDLPLADAYELESDLGHQVFLDDQAQEGMAAFVERREPSFRRG